MIRRVCSYFPPVSPACPSSALRAPAALAPRLLRSLHECLTGPRGGAVRASGSPAAPQAPCSLPPAPQAPDISPLELGGPPSAARRASCGLWSVRALTERMSVCIRRPMDTATAADTPSAAEPGGNSDAATQSAVRAARKTEIAGAQASSDAACQLPSSGLEVADAPAPLPGESVGAASASAAPSCEESARAERRSWELSAPELADARSVKWPPGHGHGISLACFGVQRTEGVPAQRRVHESLVQRCDHLKEGDECLCLDPRDGQQWLATIKKVTEHHALVHYKGWSKSTDSWVTRDKLAVKPAPHVLERIKQYNEHSKLRHSGAPKNQLSVSQPRATNGPSRGIETGTALEGREIRSRMRGVEMYRMPSMRYPHGQWRAVYMMGNQKQFIGGLFSSKEEASKAWAEREEKRVAAGAASVANRADKDALSVPPPPRTAAGQGSKFSEGGALGARVSVDMGCRRRSGLVTAWIGPKMLYQIRLDGDDGKLVHLGIPDKRVQLLKSATTKAGSASKMAASATESGEEHTSVLKLLGGGSVMDEMQDICDTASHDHVLGGHALQLARLRHLATSCDNHGIYLCPEGMNGSMEDVQYALQMALHHKLKSEHGESVEASGGGKGESSDKHGRTLDDDDEDKRYSGVRSRKSGTKEEREFNKWEAFIEFGNESHILGYYARRAEAARAWDMAAKRILPRNTPLNLSDSREFLPCQELKETISRIMLSLAACGGVRAVPSADKHGNSATIPMPAPAGRIGQPRMDRKLKDGKRDKMAFLKLHARRNINPSHKKKQLFGAGGASKEGARRSSRHQPEGRRSQAGGLVELSQQNLRRREKISRPTLKAGDTEADATGLHSASAEEAAADRAAPSSALPAADTADSCTSAPTSSVSAMASLVTTASSSSTPSQLVVPPPPPPPLSASMQASLNLLPSQLAAAISQLPAALQFMATAAAATSAAAAAQTSTPVILPTPVVLPTSHASLPASLLSPQAQDAEGSGSAITAAAEHAKTSPTASSSDATADTGADIACDTAAESTTAESIPTPPEFQQDAAATGVLRCARGSPACKTSAAVAGTGTKDGEAKLSRAVESLVEAKEVRDEESSALLPPECDAAQMGAEDVTRAENRSAQIERERQRQDRDKERKAKAEVSAQKEKERKRQARLAAQAQRAAARLNPVQPVVPNDILVKEESIASRRTSEQRARKKKRIFGADEENDNTVCRSSTSSSSDAKRICKGGGSRSRSKGGRDEVGANKKVKSGMEQLLEPVLPAYTSLGAKCEVESNGEWWDATVAARYKDRLRISYVGGDSGDDEWLVPEEHWFLVPEDHWCSRMRAVQEGDASSQSYRGVEPSDGGLWCSVVRMFPHVVDRKALQKRFHDRAGCPAAGTDAQRHREGLEYDAAEKSAEDVRCAGANQNRTGDPDFSAMDTAAGKQFGDDASGGEGRRADGGSALNPAATDRILLGTFTSARKAAQHYDCVMLECVSVDYSADMCLNLDSSRDYFLQCKANGRTIFPDSIDAATREMIKDVFLAQCLSPMPNPRSAPQAPC